MASSEEIAQKLSAERIQLNVLKINKLKCQDGRIGHMSEERAGELYDDSINASEARVLELESRLTNVRSVEWENVQEALSDTFEDLLQWTEGDFLLANRIRQMVATKISAEFFKPDAMVEDKR